MFSPLTIGFGTKQSTGGGSPSTPCPIVDFIYASDPGNIDETVVVVGPDPRGTVSSTSAVTNCGVYIYKFDLPYSQALATIDLTATSDAITAILYTPIGTSDTITVAAGDTDTLNIHYAVGGGFDWYLVIGPASVGESAEWSFDWEMTSW